MKELESKLKVEEERVDALFGVQAKYCESLEEAGVLRATAQKHADENNQLRMICKHQEQYLKDVWNWFKVKYKPSLEGQAAPECLNSLTTWYRQHHLIYKEVVKPVNNTK